MSKIEKSIEEKERKEKEKGKGEGIGKEGENREKKGSETPVDSSIVAPYIC